MLPLAVQASTVHIVGIVYVLFAQEQKSLLNANESACKICKYSFSDILQFIKC